MKSNTILIVVIALIVGFGAGFVLRPIILPAPATTTAVFTSPGSTEARSSQYFAAHIDEARRIVAGCQVGSVRSDECVNAGQAITEVEGKERMKKFVGN